MTQKTILITGASAGIGKATAQQLLSEGHVVYVAARRVDRMQDLAELGAIPIRMDITKEEDIVAAVEQVRAGHGGVDVLINNAGFGSSGAMEDVAIDDARHQFEVNLFGLARLTQLLLPHMREQRSGTIINVSSIGGKVYTPLGSWYHATKHALEGWSDCLRLELEPFGIDVVIIEPGAIETEFGDVAADHLRERSGHGPYADLAARVADAMAMSSDRNGSGVGSHPSVIARVMSRAIQARKPRTRYAAGKFSCTMLTMRRWLSDRLFDRAIMRFV